MTAPAPLDYERRRHGEPGSGRWAWRILGAVTLSSAAPLYVFAYEHWRLARDPWAYPYEWGERQPGGFVTFAVIAGFLRPVVGLACVVEAGMKPRSRCSLAYFMAAGISAGTLAFELWTGFWSTM